MERVFKRKIYQQLLDWKHKENGKTALLIEGARRVGKSTIVEEFAKNEYESYLIIDFAFASKATRELFEDISNLDLLFTSLQLAYGVSLVPGKSLVVFDEIQKCPLARQAIKYLVKDGRYHYIETGSLLGIKMKKKPQPQDTKLLIPSEEHRVCMYPMDYEEFRWALGDKATIGLLSNVFNSLQPLGDAMVRKLMRDFRLYMLVGGMPQAVNEYLDSQNLAQVDQVKRNIIQLYDNDFYELDPNGQTSMLFHAIPAQLNSNAARYQVSSVISGSRVERLMRPIAILKDSMTTNISYHSNDPSAGLALHINTEQFKLFCHDTGLFVSLAFWDSDFTSNTIYQKLLNDKLNTDLGYVFENMVAQMLVANGQKLYYHTWPIENSTRNYEIDFLLTRESKICPIEVKSAQSREHKSIDAFQNKYSSRILRRYLLHTKDIRKDQDLICLPIFLTQFL
ncbi:MAG: AAA family ATPase [Bacteroidales bacterium]|nr:AAA family ATPase [Bacteroidales bacterium]